MTNAEVFDQLLARVPYGPRRAEYEKRRWAEVRHQASLVQVRLTPRKVLWVRLNGLSISNGHPLQHGEVVATTIGASKFFEFIKTVTDSYEPSDELLADMRAALEPTQ